MITSDSKTAKIFNDYINNIVPDLGLKIPHVLIHYSPKNEDPVVNAISNYKNHRFIKIISLSKLQHSMM